MSSMQSLTNRRFRPWTLLLATILPASALHQRAHAAWPPLIQDMVSGDIDGDGRDELYLTVQEWDAYGGFRFSLYQRRHHDFGLGVKIYSYNGIVLAHLAMGDVDGDGDDELFFNGQAGNWLAFINRWEGTPGEFATIWTHTWAWWAGPMAAGDVDGDNRAELFTSFRGRASSSMRGVSRIYRNNHGLDHGNGIHKRIWENEGWTVKALATADTVGDASDEFYSSFVYRDPKTFRVRYARVYRHDTGEAIGPSIYSATNGWQVTSMAAWKRDLGDELYFVHAHDQSDHAWVFRSTYGIPNHIYVGYKPGADGRVAVGDMDGDTLPELYSSFFGGASGTWLFRDYYGWSLGQPQFIYRR